MRRSEKIIVFTQLIWQWYADHKRVLPWRDLPDADDSARAYKVLVSELMLQQTQVSRVINMYKKFIQTFPDLQSLSKATNAQVIRQWSGLGYNSRALRLRDIARVISTEHGGVFPHDFNTLLSLKGIGAYTAGAICNFAFNIPTPCIDTNIRRILHRVFVGPERPDGTWAKDDHYLIGIAHQVLEIAVDGGRTLGRTDQVRHTAAEWHAALMDYGSLVCTSRDPEWDVCPLVREGILRPITVKIVRRKKPRREPGIEIAGTFVPRRILRGRVLRAIGQAKTGTTVQELQRTLQLESVDQKAILHLIIERLQAEQFIMKKSARLMLLR